MRDDPERQAPDEQIEARRLARVWMDERVERARDERPIFGTPVTV